MRKLLFICRAWLLGIILMTLYGVAGAATLPVVKPVISCDQLLQADFNNVADAPVKLTQASAVDTAKGQFCKVTGTIAPSIGFEVYLPSERWTQRFLQEGCGGLCGNININVGNAHSCLPALNGEFVVSSTDMGHHGSMMDASWAADPQKRIDFAYRGNHQTALVTKALIKTYYGQQPRYSYFMGCSDGGREALMEAQRYPDDFDAISAGAPAAFFQFQNSFYHGWNVVANRRADGTSILLKDKLPILHQAVLAHCPTLSGVNDGLLQNPYACRFDPAWVKQCSVNQPDGKDCLTAEETQAAERLYQGARDKTGQALVLGGLPLGSELRWPVPASATEPPMSLMMVEPALQHVLLPLSGPGMASVSALPFTPWGFAQLSQLAPLYNAANTNLAPFMKRGGKLIMWHGLADDSVSPVFSLAYYKGVQKTLGAAATDSFVRLFLLPGVGHCGNGEGYDQIDLLSALTGWAEDGTAPQMLISSKVAQAPRGMPPMMMKPKGAPGQNSAEAQFHNLMPPSSPLAQAAKPALATRPVYAYPNIAHYTGKGDPNQAQNYEPQPSAAFDALVFGSPAIDYIGPDNQKNYHAVAGQLVEDK